MTNIPSQSPIASSCKWRQVQVMCTLLLRVIKGSWGGRGRALCSLAVLKEKCIDILTRFKCFKLRIDAMDLIENLKYTIRKRNTSISGNKCIYVVRESTVYVHVPSAESSDKFCLSEKQNLPIFPYTSCTRHSTWRKKWSFKGIQSLSLSVGSVLLFTQSCSVPSRHFNQMQHFGFTSVLPNLSGSKTYRNETVLGLLKWEDTTQFYFVILENNLTSTKDLSAWRCLWSHQTLIPTLGDFGISAHIWSSKIWLVISTA